MCLQKYFSGPVRVVFEGERERGTQTDKQSIFEGFAFIRVLVPTVVTSVNGCLQKDSADRSRRQLLEITTHCLIAKTGITVPSLTE